MWAVDMCVHVAVDTRSAPCLLLATRPLLWLALRLSPLARFPRTLTSSVAISVVTSCGQVDEEVAQGVTNFVSQLIEGEVPCGRRTRIELATCACNRLSMLQPL